MPRIVVLGLLLGLGGASVTSSPAQAQACIGLTEVVDRLNAGFSQAQFRPLQCPSGTAAICTKNVRCSLIGLAGFGPSASSVCTEAKCVRSGRSRARRR
jgi:hypothetical protein